MLNSALAIIRDEHRSLAAVVHGLRYLVRGINERNSKPDFRLLWAMIFYLDEFPEKLHHPKENAYLFARLRQRTREADMVIAELEGQHMAGARHIRDLELALGHYEAGTSTDGLFPATVFGRRGCTYPLVYLRGAPLQKARHQAGCSTNSPEGEKPDRIGGGF